MTTSTKMALSNSLKKILQKKFLDDITVKEIVEDCAVNRQTFYYHFQDIYDLLRWFLNHETQEVLSHAEHWRDSLMATFQYLQENHILVYHVFQSSGRGYIDCQFFSFSRALISALLDQDAVDLSIPEPDRMFLLDFYMYALSGILTGWLSTDMKESPQLLVSKVSHLLEGEIRRAAERFSSPV